MLFKSLSPGQRDAFFSTESGVEWLKALTPSEYADLFPDYITERKRRASASVSGGTSVGSGGMRPYQSWIPGNQSHRGVGRRSMGPSGGYDSRGGSGSGSDSGSPQPGSRMVPSIQRKMNDRLRALGITPPSEQPEQKGRSGLSSWAGAPLSSHRVEAINKTQYAKMIEEEARAAGIDPNVAKAIAHIESSGIHNTKTGLYSGLYRR